MSKKPKRPRDTNQLAKSIVDSATSDNPTKEPKPTKNAAAVALGKLGGLKGGKARAENLTPEQRSAIAKNAAKKRWRKK